MAAFGDLCVVQHKDQKVTEELISEAVKLGYETIAVSSTFFLTNFKKGQCKSACPQPVRWNQVPGVMSLKDSNNKLKILSRLTIPLEENSQIHQLATDVVLSYDILAVRPATEKLFQQSCGTLEVDVISLDFTSKLPFYIKLPQVRQAIGRGIHFEILYSPAIRDSLHRRYVISNTLELVRTCKGRNIIISSEAERMMDLRGPYDVANLGLLFGLKEEQSKSSVSRNVRAVLYHSKARRSKSTIDGCHVSSVKHNEMWTFGKGQLDTSCDDDDDDDDDKSSGGDERPKEKKLKTF